MKIPEKVKIGAHVYSVDFDIDPSNDGDMCFGCVSNQKLKITIDKNVQSSQVEETFLHEVLHAIFYLNGLAKKDSEEEEMMVQPIAHAFYQFLKENDLLK